MSEGGPEIVEGDGFALAPELVGEGGAARGDPSTVRKVRNASDADDLVYVVVGGKDGYIGRDGRRPEGETRR